jgi:hypothetical protein
LGEPRKFDRSVRIESFWEFELNGVSINTIGWWNIANFAGQ